MNSTPVTISVSYRNDLRGLDLTCSRPQHDVARSIAESAIGFRTAHPIC